MPNVIPAVDDPPTPVVKPGWQSSEFWVALAGQLAGLVLALAPLLRRSPEEGQLAANAVRDAALHVGGLVVIGVGVWQYVKARKEVKIVTATAQAEIAAVRAGAAPSTSPRLLVPPGP